MPLSRFLPVLLAALTGAAHSHGARSDVLITLDAPLQTAGVTVQLHQGAIAPQLVLENRSGKLLEIDDARGRPFLRIGPQGVEADVNSAAWRDSLNPVGASADGEPRWKKIRTAASHGWFDRRIDPEPLVIPQPITIVGAAAPLGTWRIAARLDDRPIDFHGRFLYRPPPRGRVETALHRAELAPGIHLELAAGAVPALLLRNRSGKTVNVLDAQGRVLHRIATGQQHTWLEPRAAFSGASPQNPSQAQPLGDWQIPVQIGHRRLWIRGTHEWRPVNPP